MGLMAGKKCLIMGVANHRSIAWGIAQALHREGAELAFTYQNDRLRKNVEKLVDQLESDTEIPLLPLDVTEDEQIENLFSQVGDMWGELDVLVHSLAYAKSEDLTGIFSEITRDGYKLAHEISAWSLIATAKHAKPLMEAAGGGSILTMTYMAAERVVNKYNVMATAKAALECNVRYLAAELGASNIRVNGVSAGPIRTLAASAVKGISDIRGLMEEKAPLRRNVTQEEVGDVGLFLASDLSRCVTGEIIYADNGFNIIGV